jgi:hypothetical protein
MSYWYTATRPVNKAVKPPIIVIINSNISEYSKIKEERIIKKTPAVH